MKKPQLKFELINTVEISFLYVRGLLVNGLSIFISNPSTDKLQHDISTYGQIKIF